MFLCWITYQPWYHPTLFFIIYLFQCWIGPLPVTSEGRRHCTSVSVSASFCTPVLCACAPCTVRTLVIMLFRWIGGAQKAFVPTGWLSNTHWAHGAAAHCACVLRSSVKRVRSRRWEKKRDELFHVFRVRSNIARPTGNNWDGSHLVQSRYFKLSWKKIPVLSFKVFIHSFDVLCLIAFFNTLKSKTSVTSCNGHVE